MQKIFVVYGDGVEKNCQKRFNRLVQDDPIRPIRYTITMTETTPTEVSRRVKRQSNTGKQMTRLEFLKVLGFGALGLLLPPSLTACDLGTPSPSRSAPDRTPLPQPTLIRPPTREPVNLQETGVDPLPSLRQFLGVTTDTTRDEIRQKALETKNSQGWGTNERFGPFTNSRGESIFFSTASDGEPNIRNIPEFVIYPDNGELDVFAWKSGENFLYVYGTAEFVNRFREKLSGMVLQLDGFLNDYFALSKAKKRILHLDFLPFRRAHDYKGMESDLQTSIQLPSRIAATHSDKNVAGQVKKTDVVGKLNSIHNYARFTGLALEDALVEILVNEWVGIAVHEESTREEINHLNEAYSTWLGILSKYDPHIAQTALGGTNYQEVIQAVVEQMQILSDPDSLT